MDAAISQPEETQANAESQILEALKGRSESAETEPTKVAEERNDAEEEILGESEETEVSDESDEPTVEDTGEAEEEEEEDPEEDVLSQSDSTEDANDDLIDILDNLSPEGLENFKKRINTRAGDRFVKLTREKKALQAQLAEAQTAATSETPPAMVIAAEDSHKPFSKCGSETELRDEVKKYKSVSKELDRALRKADRQALEDDDTLEVSSNGQSFEMTVAEARSRLELAEVALEDEAPSRATFLANRKQNEAQVSNRFDWHAKKDSVEVKNFGILDDAVGQYIRKLPNGTFILSALAEWATKEQQSSKGIQDSKKDNLKRKVAKLSGSGSKAPRSKSTSVKTESSKLQEQMKAAQARLSKSGSGRDLAKILKLRAQLKS
jgi:hypothetical protein